MTVTPVLICISLMLDVAVIVPHPGELVCTLVTWYELNLEPKPQAIE